MRTQRTVRAALPLAMGLVATLSAAPAFADNQASKSAAVAKELAQQLDSAKLSHIAAKDPEDPNRFIAAMYFPGMQIVAVSGAYSVPVLLNEKLMQRNYQEIYIDLSSASERASRITIEDLRCDGLPAARIKDAPNDAWEQGTSRIVFDFDWKGQKMSEEDFFKKLTAADEQYTRMLSLLLAEAKKGS